MTLRNAFAELAQEHTNSAGDAHLVSGSKLKYRREFNDPALADWDVVTGPNQTVTSGTGVCTVAMGTTVNAETSLVTKQDFTAPFKVSVGLQLSQKIANNEVYAEIVAENEDGSLDETVVAAWRIAGSDTTALTSARYEVRNGSAARLQSANVTGQASQTSPAAVYEITLESDEVWFTSRAADSSVARTIGGVRNSVAPDPNRKYRIRLRCRNGGTAPASGTTVTLYFVTAVDYTESQVEVTGGNGNSSPAQSVPVNIVGGATTATPSLAASATVAGTAIAKVLSAASTNAALVKATAGRVYGYHFANSSAAWRYVKLYNKASAPVPGTDVPVLQIPIPPGGVAVVDRSVPISFATGIGIAVVAGPADNDATAIVANEVMGHLLYL